MGSSARPELALMKPAAWLVNTSRGPLVDEPALIDALTRRTIAGAALDVFDTEPLPPRHPFRTLDNVVGEPTCRLRYDKDLCDILHGHGGEPARLDGWLPDSRDVGRLACLAVAALWLAAAAQPTPQQLHDAGAAQSAELARAQDARLRQRTADDEARRLADARVASAASLRSARDGDGRRGGHDGRAGPAPDRGGSAAARPAPPSLPRCCH